MLGSRVRAPKGAQGTEIRNGLRFSYMLSSALPAIAVGSVVLFFYTHEVMLGRGRAHGLTILKRIYKNYKEKIVFMFAFNIYILSLQAQKESDEFSSQHGLN